MTRFLSRMWLDPDCGGLNSDTDRLFAYHQATKHTYHSVRTNARYLDWHNQPNPFRGYEGVPSIDLPPEPGFPNSGTFAAMAALAENTQLSAEAPPEHAAPIQLDLALLSRLLWHSMAISAWKKVPGTGARYSLRVNPSSGNLHPTELYVALRDFTKMEGGLYHYRADRHAIELRSRGAWTQHLSRALEIPWASESPLIVALTSIFWREAWKYGERAYRYCCHDVGHAMMSVLLAARALGLPGGSVAHFSDLRLARAMGLAESDEAPMAFLDFDARTPPMERDELEQLLDFSTRDWRADWRGNFSGAAPPVENVADFVALYLYVHRVRDCEPGVYRWNRVNRNIEQLHLGNVQRVAAFLSLEQSLAGNSCFTVSMIADLGEAARVFGNRGYRYVYFEAGAIGQRLYTGAEALGWNATGIGAFYDDDVHRYLGFLEEGADSVGASVREAEKAALVMLGSPSSRFAAQPPGSREDVPVISESGEGRPTNQEQLQEKNEALPRTDPRKLPHQVVYHFAVGRAIPDPRIEA